MTDSDLNGPPGSDFNPYVGPRPFRREDRDLFFGRNREVRDISSLIIAHPILLVYGKSGTGKTSLLNTHVEARLEEREGFEVFHARVCGSAESIDFDAIPNIFVFNTISALREGHHEPAQLGQVSLSEVLREQPRRPGVDGLPVLRVLILDQLEELFTSYPERWKDRVGFFKEIRAAVEHDPLLRIVFSMREDYIAELDPYAATFPENLRTRFRVERLRRSGALEAITNPLRVTERGDGGRRFAHGVAESLVSALMRVHAEEKEFEGEFVDLLQLQIVCQRLWNHLRPDTREITRHDLEAFGNVDRALIGFYEDTVRRVATEARIPERKLRSWFERVLITPMGTRAIAFRGPVETAGMPNSVVDALEQAQLLRSERRAGARWCELSHDRLVKSIQDSNSNWKQAFG